MTACAVSFSALRIGDMAAAVALAALTSLVILLLARQTVKETTAIDDILFAYIVFILFILLLFSWVEL